MLIKVVTVNFSSLVDDIQKLLAVQRGAIIDAGVLDEVCIFDIVWCTPVLPGDRILKCCLALPGTYIR